MRDGLMKIWLERGCLACRAHGGEGAHEGGLRYLDAGERVMLLVTLLEFGKIFIFFKILFGLLVQAAHA